jgi:phage terminase small subunit
MATKPKAPAKSKVLDKTTVVKKTPAKTTPKPAAKTAKATPVRAVNGGNKVSGEPTGIQKASKPKPKAGVKKEVKTASPAQMLKEAQKAALEQKDAEPSKNEVFEVGVYAEVFAEIVKNFDLSEREARFVMEMAVDGNASAAYVRAGYEAKNAKANASRMSAKDNVQAGLAHVRAKVAERAGFSAEEALQMAADILRADTRELVEYRVSNCRYCYGDHHLYQRTAGEMAMARVKHESMVSRRQERNKDYEDPGFDELGGEGFDLRRDPNTECPVCAGEGAGRVVIKDTRTVSKAAAALYAGVKEGKDGIEVKFHDKATMLDKMFRYHGLYEVDNKQKATAAADPAALIALSEAMDRSREERRAIMEKRRQSGFPGD